MKDVEAKEFWEELKEGTVVVDLWADWCRPCKAIEPYLRELAKNYPQVKFLRLNTDEYPEVPMELGVVSIPTILFFRDGKEVKRIVGAKPKHVYQRTLQEVVGS
ncbi:MAG: thioredoxin [Thermotogae bacterium]|nr:thioredoxin [Thermotogota bacterium]